HHRAAEHRAGGGDRDPRHEVLADALEALVLGDDDLDVEVAGPRPGLTGVAGAADPDPLAGLDAGGHLHLPGPLADEPAPAAALPARGLGGLAGAAAGRTGAAPDH